MHTTLTKCVLSIMLSILLCGPARMVGAEAVYTLLSPNKRIAVKVTVGERIRWGVSFHGQPVVLDSPFALEFRDGPPLGTALAVRDVKRTIIHSTWENPLGKRRQVVENGNQIEIDMQELAPTGRKLNLLLRAYDDGVALRYVLPEQEGFASFVLTKEDLRFRFAGDPTVWAANYGGYSSSQESEFRRQPMSALSDERPYGTPLLIQVNLSSNSLSNTFLSNTFLSSNSLSNTFLSNTSSNKTCFAAITEADLQDWAGLYLSRIPAARSERLAETPILRGGQEPQKLSVPLTGKRRLRLIIGDGGDDFVCDHADWGNARLITTDGKEVPLGSLTPVSAVQGFGALKVDKSVEGNPLKIGSKTYAHGLGSHSKGEIVYDLNGKYARFEAEVGIDTEVGAKGSATFGVYAEWNEAETGLVTRLAPRKDGLGLVRAAAPCKSPWRVLLLGDRAGDLVESDMVLNLSEPNALGDTSWVQPGKCAWDHWWSGDVKMDTPTQKEYIQFAADMGFPYQLVDWQWYGAFNTPTADITKVNPNVDMPELIRFAKERRVRLFVWIHSNDVNRFLTEGQLDDVFTLYNKWGLAGVKIDFMDRDDQEMVNWYHTIIKLAARHHLMVDFHGAYKPTGTQRTYPNQITREGVLGEEYDKFSNRVTPEHDCTLPFTRMLAGPMDYTPGGFLNRSRDKWKQANPTQVQGTRCHELAKFVIFDSPLTVLCDHPNNYKNQPGLEFLKVVPTVWDDTKIVDGFPGEFVLSARRSGKSWFLGGMTNWDARTVEIPLKFLGDGRYTAHIFQDAPDADTEAEHLSASTREVTAKDSLKIRMASGGGLAIQFTPATVQATK